jgi:hypothetical protein
VSKNPEKAVVSWEEKREKCVPESGTARIDHSPEQYQ